MVVCFPCVYSAPSVACSINTAALLTCLSAASPVPVLCALAPAGGGGGGFPRETGDCFPGGPSGRPVTIAAQPIVALATASRLPGARCLSHCHALSRFHLSSSVC